MHRSSRAGRTPVRAAIVLVIPILSACAAATMDVPTDLASVAPMPVEGRGRLFEDQEARFGAWEAADVDRSWTRGSGWSVGVGNVSGGRNRASQEFAFRFLEDGVEVARVGCLALGGTSGGVTAIVGVEFGTESLECAPVTDSVGAEPAWELLVQAERNNHLMGHLRIGEERLAVASTGPGGGIAPATTYGFEVRDGERVIAAVETVNAGSVRIAPEVTGERRTVIAAVAAALLLYERIQPEM